MKRFFLTPAIYLLLFTDGYGQHGDYRHDVQFSAGLQTSEHALFEGYANLVLMFFLRETITPLQRSNGLYGTYRYRVTRRISAGLTAGTTFLNTREPLFNDSGKTGGRYRYTSPMIAVEAQFHYIDRPKWSFYGIAGAGIGRTFERYANGATGSIEKIRHPLLTVHFTPIGVRYGKTTGIFAELGYGYRGILNTGISVRLK